MENGLTMTGAIMANRRDVPKETRCVKSRDLYSTIELWESSKKVLLLSHVPKKNKNVLLMSSMHSDAGVEECREDRKPLVIQDYNHGKGGVDIMDSCIEDFSFKRKTNRYPLVTFIQYARHISFKCIPYF